MAFRLIALLVGLQVTASALFAVQEESRNSSADSADEIFKERILPIFKSKKPSSCTECHLSGVDLGDYIDKDPKKTFAYLRDAGLISLEDPEGSKILKLIKMKPEKASLITEKMRKLEYEAFESWILAAVKDPELAKAEAKGKPLGPKLPDEVIRHARRDLVFASFVENVWSEKMRCQGCHAPEGKKTADHVKNFGPGVEWYKKTAKESFEYLLSSKLMDLKNPMKSLLLTKPTLQVKHKGGKKMLEGDRTYKMFYRFIEDYSKVLSGKYRKEKELPSHILTEQWIRIEKIPGPFRKKMMEVEVFRKEKGRWGKKPFARALASWITPKGFWQGPLEITVPRESEDYDTFRAKPEIPDGEYMVRVYVDVKSKLARKPFYKWTRGDLFNQIIVENGFPQKGPKSANKSDWVRGRR